MKIISFSPGLGNQIFQFAFCEYLRRKFPKEKIYGYYNRSWLNKHNGLEVDKVFDVNLPIAKSHTNFIVLLLRIYRKFNKKSHLISQHVPFNTKSIFYDGWWHDKEYVNDIIQNIKFKEISFDDINCSIFDEIKKSFSVSIHFRRGDYLDLNIQQRYGNICTLDYYLNAIEYIINKYEQPKFFVFSDDINWVKENLTIPGANYVSNNQGKNSYIDLYLMSQCKGSIIANSTFSFFGAYINSNVKEVIIYPKVWINDVNKPDIFPESWLGF